MSEDKALSILLGKRIVSADLDYEGSTLTLTFDDGCKMSIVAYIHDYDEAFLHFEEETVPA